MPGPAIKGGAEGDGGMRGAGAGARRAVARIAAPRPALLLEGERRILAISDLHIGLEAGLAANDIHVDQSGTADEAIADVREIVRAERPDALAILGDVRSGTRSISGAEWDGIPRFFEAACGEAGQVIVTPGNHDSNIERLAPEGVSLTSPAGTVLEGALLTHGHTMPSENLSVDRIVMGHLHPVFRSEGSLLDGERVWVSVRTDRAAVFPSRSGALEVTVLPSFSRHLHAPGGRGWARRRGGKRSISPIMERILKARREGSHEVSARIATLDGAVIGDESVLDCAL